MEEYLYKIGQILVEDRRQRANPPQKEIVAKIRPRYRTPLDSLKKKTTRLVHGNTGGM
jgi:hypothetical protein